MEPIKVRLYRDRFGHSFTAYAVNGNTPYDWMTGQTKAEAMAKLKSKYIEWRDRPFEEVAPF